MAELHQLWQHTNARLTGDDAEELTNTIESTLQPTPGPDYSWPGNVRELEQALRRMLLTSSDTGSTAPKSKDLVERLITGIEIESLEAVSGPHFSRPRRGTDMPSPDIHLKE
jgi:DNA-binding NtrC family response regulator